MNKTLHRQFFAGLLAMACVSGTLQAQDKSNLLGQLNTITTAVPFLIISPDARAGGMGDGGVAASPDAYALHWNPSKIAFAEKKTGIAISYTPWLRNLVPDINLSYVSFYTKLKSNDQAIGASLRYFSLGDITFTDNAGNDIGQYKPAEFAFDVTYARQLSENFSGGISLRYIHSNLTGGFQVENNATKAGNSVAADISAYFHNDIKLGKKDAVLAIGLNISNIGSKISYTETGTKDFIPTNLRLGPRLTMKLNEYNELTLLVDFNKLLVPTPPVYSDSLVNGEQVILFGKSTDVSVAQGIFQSFSDAPNGFKEEMQEINIATGFEYWYDKQFAFRAGYFYENENKGNRKYFTLGAGLKLNVIGLDFAYLIPTDQRNPLENTLRFSIIFDFDTLKKKNDDSAE
ncbi:MAG TPA: type IX secretion system outer membrane channel protein PorV [Bacteroidia bacterium]|nr:type IX secretion system outer membrane channel protein PorV [Bacteroidia bacterium]